MKRIAVTGATGLIGRHLVRHWYTLPQLAVAIFEWIEAWYNPRRRHTSIASLSPIDYEGRATPAASAA